MRSSEIKVLQGLIETPSPSGFEEKIAEMIRNELLKYLPRNRVKIDEQKNVIAIIKGKSNKTIMVDAHSDQIGFIVNNIDKEGFISLQYIGDGDKSILSARNLIILTDSGRINAIVNRKHSHLIDDEGDESIGEMKDVIVDIGIRKKRSVKSKVKIGDPVVYKPHFSHLMESYYSGCGFDDKSGCFILIKTIKSIIKLKIKPVSTLIFTFSTQEEVGGQKFKPIINKYKPNLFIEVDATFATDWNDDDVLERESGKCKLGGGIVLFRGVDIDKKSLKLMASSARKNKIKIQYQASTGDDGTVNYYVSALNNGIKTLLIGVPLRNMHTSVEIINLKDLNYGSQLLTNFLLSKRINTIFNDVRN